jgi:hypothetical protein
MFATALYKGTRAGADGLYNRIVRAVDHGPYSHTEIVFGDGLCGSCSFLDGGMRLKRIEFEPARWDFIALPQVHERGARAYFEARAGKVGYDLRGNLRFLLPWERASRTRRFCSWACWESLGLPEGWRFGPNSYALLMAEICAANIVPGEVFL